jgi:hypothetical protein
MTQAPVLGGCGTCTREYSQGCPQVVNKQYRRCPQLHPQVCAQVRLLQGTDLPNVGAGFTWNVRITAV